MKKIAKRLALTSQTIRPLQSDELRHVAGGTTQSGPSVIAPTISASGPSVIRPTTSQSGPSVISISGGH